jgi:hypothetical protein
MGKLTAEHGQVVRDQYNILQAWSQDAAKALMDVPEDGDMGMSCEEFTMHSLTYLLSRLTARLIINNVSNPETAIESVIDILREEFKTAYLAVPAGSSAH